jgi:hypothetical protein
MPPAVAIYPTGSVPVAAPNPVPGFQPPTSAAPFDARNYVPPPSEPPAGPFDARNYVPPDSTPMFATTYEPHTSESAFNNSMTLHGIGGVTSPVVPPASYLLSPGLSSSSSGDSYSQSMPPGLSRSSSHHPKEREVWLYDRPGTWRPRFQMPRSGVGSLMRNFSQMRNFPPGASYDSVSFFSSVLLGGIHSPPNSRYHVTDFRRTHTICPTPGVAGDVGPPRRLFAGRVPRSEASGHGLRPDALYHGAADAVHETVSCTPAVVHRSPDRKWGRRHVLRSVLADPGRALVTHQEFGFLQQRAHARRTREDRASMEGTMPVQPGRKEPRREEGGFSHAGLHFRWPLAGPGRDMGDKDEESVGGLYSLSFLI